MNRVIKKIILLLFIFLSKHFNVFSTEVNKKAKSIDELNNKLKNYFYTKFEFDTSIQSLYRLYSNDSAKGGFAYKFSFADNSSFFVPNGTGPSKYNPLVIDTTGLRVIKHAPVFGVHPRIYCNPEDSTSIKWRLQNTASGRALSKYIHTITTLLQLGQGGATGYSTNANYARDTLGNVMLGNVGFTNVKPMYDSLAAGDIGVVNNYTNLWGGNALRMANVLSYEAFECWLYRGTIDPVTNTSYTQRAQKLSRAVSIWAQRALANTSFPLSFANRDRFGSLQMALIYDFLYDQMTTNQRDSVRMALAAIAIRDSMNLNLVNSPSFTVISNWATFGYEIMPLLAIEGEQGYTQQNENALRAYCRILLSFFNYGIYEATGAPVEGTGKNQLNIAMLTTLARRGYSLLGHPAVKAYAQKYYPAIQQPFGYSMLGTDLLGGTGYLGLNGQYVSASTGGWKHILSLDLVAYKWIFPRDTTVDFLYKNFIQRSHARSATAPHSYYFHEVMRTSLSQPTYWNYLWAAAFVSDYTPTPFHVQAQHVYQKKMYFDSLGGFAVMRSGFDTMSHALFYHNRTDIGGHTLANKNDIVYSALGRIWIPRVFSNANSNYALASGTKMMSSILINNIGQSVDTTTAQNLDILPIPAKIVAYKQTPEYSLIAGNAKDAYTFSWSYLFGGYTGDNPLLSNSAYSRVLTPLNSFRYAQYYNFDNTPLYNRLTQGNYSWVAGARYARTVSRSWLLGNVQKVFRTVAMINDAKPYILVTDDVQRNNSMNNYKWIAQLANDLVVDSIVVNLSNTNYRNDIIFREPTATGNRRFLVRVLNNTGAISSAVPAYVDSVQNPINNVSPNNKLPRLVVESNSIDPQYKIMLFVYREGETLPFTSWSATRDRLFINNSGTIKTIVFPVDTSGRTNIQIVDGVLALNIKLAGFLLNKSVAKLDFHTKEQTNVLSYVVEKSNDGNRFTSVALIKSSNNIHDNYSWHDTALSAINYYRIKTEAKDGKVLYSNSIVLKLNKVASIQVYPNPFLNNQLNIQFNNVLAGVYDVSLADITGRNIFKKKYAIKNNQALQILLPSLTKGLYQITVSNPNNLYRSILLN